MTGIRLFASDLDGTLVSFSGDHAASARFAEAWRTVPDDRRPVLCFNSGRLVDDLRQAAHEAGLPPPDYLIGGVGTTIVDAEGQPLREYQAPFHAGWDRSLITEIVTATPKVIPQHERYQSLFKSSWHWHDASDEDIADLRHRLQRAELDVTVIYSSSRDLDVIPSRADKGNAIRFLARHLGCELESVVVAGDTGNDSNMFRVPGVRGITVGNARPELLAAIDRARCHCSTAVDADGVIDGLVHWGVFDRA